MLNGGGKSLFLLIISLFFVSAYFSSCAKEEVIDPESGIFRDGGGEPGSYTCRCYMQIRSVENPPNDSNFGLGWLWEDQTFFDEYWTYEIKGTGAFWEDENGLLQPFPTPFQELNQVDFSGSSAGQHELVLTYLGGGSPPSNFTLHTKTECYQVDDNTG